MATEPFLGEIRLFSFNFNPKGWVPCNGQLLPINQNQALFAILGTYYGGNGTTNFALPNIQGRMAVGVGSGFNLGQAGGEQSHALTTSEIPQIGGQIQVNSGTGSTNTPGPTLYLATPATPDRQEIDLYSNSPANTALGQAISGGNQPHNNMPPYLVLNYCIAIQGIFPSQN